LTGWPTSKEYHQRLRIAQCDFVARYKCEITSLSQHIISYRIISHSQCMCTELVRDVLQAIHCYTFTFEYPWNMNELRYLQGGKTLITCLVDIDRSLNTSLLIHISLHSVASTQFAVVAIHVGNDRETRLDHVLSITCFAVY
jgi:hypothetical protein